MAGHGHRRHVPGDHGATNQASGKLQGKVQSVKPRRFWRNDQDRAGLHRWASPARNRRRSSTALGWSQAKPERWSMAAEAAARSVGPCGRGAGLGSGLGGGGATGAIGSLVEGWNEHSYSVRVWIGVPSANNRATSLA